VFPTFNILNRILRIEAYGSVGTGTLVEFRDRQFIVTAAHVVQGVHAGDKLNVEARWTKGTISILRKDARSDTATLVVGRKVENLPPCDIGGNFALGQDVFLAGFPAGEGTYVDFKDGEDTKRELNPFLRKGIISTVRGKQELIVDSLIQKGFSGGPVFIGQSAPGKPPAIIGVISSGLVFPQDKSVLDESGGVTIRSGFTSCQMIRIAREMMEDDLKRHP
jgi:hypothetical protein